MHTQEFNSNYSLNDLVFEQLDEKLRALGFVLYKSESETFWYQIPLTSKRAVLDLSNSERNLEFYDSEELDKDEIRRIKADFSNSFIRVLPPSFSYNKTGVYLEIKVLVN
jgi:hypothetical protein